MKTNRGMTIVEALVWIAVFTAAMLALVSSVLYFYRTSNYAIQEAAAVASAQRGIDTMVREIREASYASNGAYPIVSLAANDLVFYSDVDTDTFVERVHYYISNNQLIRGVLDPSGNPLTYSGTESTSVVSDSLQNAAQNISLFAYYNASGTQITDYTKIADVRFVTANIAVDIDVNRSPVVTVLRSSAALRNLVGK